MSTHLSRIPTKSKRQFKIIYLSISRYGGDFRKGSYCLVVLSTINFILLIIDEFWRSNSGSRLQKLSGYLKTHIGKLFYYIYQKIVRECDTTMFPHILHNCLVLYSHQLQYLLGERVQVVSSLVWPHDVHITRNFSTSGELLRATRYRWLYESNAAIVWIFRIFYIVRNLIDSDFTHFQLAIYHSTIRRLLDSTSFYVCLVAITATRAWRIYS